MHLMYLGPIEVNLVSMFKNNVSLLPILTLVAICSPEGCNFVTTKNILNLVTANYNVIPIKKELTFCGYTDPEYILLVRVVFLWLCLDIYKYLLGSLAFYNSHSVAIYRTLELIY